MMMMMLESKRRQKLWARALGYIMMVLPLGGNNCFGFGFGFCFGFSFGFGFVFGSRFAFRLDLLCSSQRFWSSARGSRESLATGAKMQLCSGLPANIYRFVGGYSHR